LLASVESQLTSLRNEEAAHAAQLAQLTAESTTAVAYATRALTAARERGPLARQTLERASTAAEAARQEQATRQGTTSRTRRCPKPRRFSIDLVRVMTGYRGSAVQAPPDSNVERIAVVAASKASLDEPSTRHMLWHMPDNEHPTEARRASLFRNGRNQALRIPKVFELPGDEVMVHREGNRLIIEPITKKRGLLETLAELQPLDEELPDVDEALLPLDDIDLDRA
jgi:antitoxin VapB